MARSIISKFLAAAAMLALPLTGHVAFAQSNPSAQQIINSLKPTGSLSDTTRGIKPIGPGGSDGGGMSPGMQMSAPNGPSGIHVASNAPPSANLDVVFHPGSAALTPQAVMVLDHLGQALTSKQLADYKFKIIGHTDTTGVAAANIALSQARAAAVENYLNTKFKVPTERLQTSGVGEADLLVPTPPQTAELRNRRVQIVNLGQ